MTTPPDVPVGAEQPPFAGVAADNVRIGLTRIAAMTSQIYNTYQLDGSLDDVLASWLSEEIDTTIAEFEIVHEHLHPPALPF